VTEIVEHILAPGGRERVTIYRRVDGYYKYSHDKSYVDDLPEDNHYMEYWSPVYSFGIYDSLETARREASAQYAWVAAGDE
jgi:hypothetical protein